MRERVSVTQHAGEPRRRWFSSPNLDLIVWFDQCESITGFELCYDKGRIEHAVRWKPRSGFAHMVVDDGESRPGKYKATPILRANGYFDATRIHAAFASECASVPTEISTCVLQALESHPNYREAK